MLIVISPAKTLDFNNARIVNQQSAPEYTKQAKQLVTILKKQSPEELMKLMSISDKLASLNNLRFKQWIADPTIENGKQAVCAFKGEVYTGLNVDDWSNENFSFAQEHLRILSGLYGVLRPLDIISAYRLEMGTKLENPKGKNLYNFWGDTINKNIQKQLNTQGDNVLINLASNEYYKSVNAKKLKAEIITPVFKDFKNGQYKVLSFFAKKARGLMTRYIIQNELKNAEEIKHFTEEGYFYNDKLSKGNEWVFTRDSIAVIS